MAHENMVRVLIRFQELGTVLVDIYSLWSACRSRQQLQWEYLEII
jgi:hypothetical protein